MSTRAEKERRQKRIAIGGAILLVAVLAFQGPRTLKMLKGDSATSSAAPASVSASTPSAVPAQQSAAPKQLPVTVRGTRKDPFAPRAVAGPGDDTPVGKQVGFKLAGDDPEIQPDKPVPGSLFTVVLRSIPIASGRGSAERAARQFRAKGLRRVGVLRSSDYETLRGGYYVVHAGRFATWSAALPTLMFARRTGANTPYIRPLRA